MKVSIIGAGNMGGAIAKGLAEKFDGEISISVSNRTNGKLNALKRLCPNIQISTNNAEVIERAEMVILAVKPWILPNVISELSGHIDGNCQTLISVAGGVSLDDLDLMLSGCNALPAVFHLIPNTAIAVGKSMTFASCRRADDNKITIVKQLFGALGDIAVIEERLMGAATALSSCGIAYVYKYVQACVQAGVQLGFYPADALKYAISTVDGAIALMQANGSSPQTEIDKVTTPGGMTIKGINELEHCGFVSAVINAILAPLKKQ